MSAAAAAVAEAVTEVERLAAKVRKAEVNADNAEENNMPEYKQAQAKAALAEAKAALAKAEVALAPDDEAAQKCLEIAIKSWNAAVNLLEIAVETHKHLAAAGEPLRWNRCAAGVVGVCMLASAQHTHGVIFRARLRPCMTSHVVFSPPCCSWTLKCCPRALSLTAV